MKSLQKFQIKNIDPVTLLIKLKLVTTSHSVNMKTDIFISYVYVHMYCTYNMYKNIYNSC